MSRWVRASVTAVCAAGLLTSGLLATAEAAATSPRTATSGGALDIPVDRQDYVAVFTTKNPTDGTTVDPYDGDPSSIHVAINGGQEFARSFVHVALDYIPTGTVATAATMTLHLTAQSDASNTGVYPLYNVNTSQAIVEACALTTELPRQFDASKPPAYDCQHGSAVGKPNKDGSIWTFDLHGLLGYWHEHGNTGAALIPIGAGDPGQNWQVAFYRSRSTAHVFYDVAPTAASRPPVVRQPAAGHVGGVPGPGANSSGGTPLTTTSGSKPATSVIPPTTSLTTPGGSAPSVATAVPPATSVVPARHSSGGSSPVWPWVLLGSLALAGGSIAWAHRAAILAAMPRGVSMFRTHPRAYSVAAAALSWGLVFSAYSVVTKPATHTPELATDQQLTPTTSGPQAPGAPAVAGAHSPNGVPGASGPSSGTAVTTGQSSTGGTVAAGSSNPSVRASQTEFTGPGTYQTIDGVRVFFPSNGGVPVAQLYSGADDVIGLTSNQLRICAHAALTYGSAFHISASDLDVFWHKVNDAGGVFGRKVATNYQNDNYDPGTAVQAAQTCKDWNAFLLLGGIGFDQIPAVRQWAEQNHELYLHHIATIEGSAGLRYSFSMLPTVEQAGTYLGQVAARELRGKKIAIIYRQSSNWTPALAPFKKVVKAAGSQIVGEYGVQINQGNYTQELTEARSAGAQVVLSWENALSEIEMIKQAQGQNWHPAWLVNGFNIITNTLGSTALDQDMWSAGEWDAYDPGYYGGGFTSYASQIKEFEAEYRKYDSGADLKGDGGDLLFLNWEAQKWLYDLLLTCGKDCTRNKMAGLMLAGYHKVTPPNCPATFGAAYDHHHAGYLFNVLHDVRDPNGRANFVPVARCVGSF